MTIRTATSTSAGPHSRTNTASAFTRLYRAASTSNRTLWATQGILAVVFLFAGVSKLVMSGEALSEGPLSVEFIRFIGVCEALGACGLVLPGAFGIRRELTPLAAAGLFVIMVGAVVVTVADMGVVPAAMPFLVGVACAFVAIARSRELRNGVRRSEARAFAS